MTCDICSAASAGPRCPICRHTFGDALASTQLTRVEPPTRAQRTEDNNHGWTDTEDEGR